MLVLAGVVATAGITMVTLAPSALTLATGVLIAGSSTGIASPPLAEAVTRWVRADSEPRAQTLVNAGTGVGVLVSGPVALLLFGHWRWAWAMFALGAAVVTWWVHALVPSDRDDLRGGAPTVGGDRAAAAHHPAT